VYNPLGHACNSYGTKQTVTQAEIVKFPKAKATLIKRKVGYGHQQQSRQKKKRGDGMVIDGEAHRD